MIDYLDNNFWKNKKVFLTGHTGFKGSWLSIWLKKLGASVAGFSLEPPSNPSLFIEANVSDGMLSIIGDIRNLENITESMIDFSPDILIHMAAQPLVRLSYDNPIETFETNIMGTVNIFEAAKKCSDLKAIVNITTDKCYENKEWVWGYRENDPMGGHDPYSSSKGCVELITSAYRKSFFNEEFTHSLASARAGNVIGGGDWATDRLIPDILKALKNNKPVLIRNPKAIRPWQHVLEPLSGYLNLAQKLFAFGQSYAEAWNFGPQNNDAKPVSWVVENIIEQWGGNNSWKKEITKQPYESKILKLDISKANNMLNWKPLLTLSQALGLTIDWHKSWLNGDNAEKLCLEQIYTFEKKQSNL